MTHREFLAWRRFYASRPFDDTHRYHRPAALVAASFGGGSQEVMRNRLDWLRNEDRPAPAAANDEAPKGKWTAADLATMKALMGE